MSPNASLCFRAPLTPEEEAKKIQIRKERRRLQEKLRRLKRNKVLITLGRNLKISPNCI